MSKSCKNKRIRNTLVWSIIALLCAAMGILEFLPITFSKDSFYDALIGRTIQQLCGIVAVILLLRVMSIKAFGKPQKWLYLIPCVITALNNFQWWSYFNGLQWLVRTGVVDILLFAFYCLCVGMFEEFVFRGVLFSILAGHFPKNKKGLVRTFVVSSIAFGLAHILNFNILQVFYTMLTGGLFAFVLLKTKNLVCCGFIHALYNFCGLLMGQESEFGLGAGIALFNTGTILTMGAVAVAMVVFVLYSLYKYPENEREILYERLGVKEKPANASKTEEESDNNV